MRTETKQINIYDYNDVINNETLKTKVLKNLQDINVDYDWWTWIVDDWIDENDKKGIEFIRKSLKFDLYEYGGCKCDYEVDIDKLLPYIESLTDKEKKRVKYLIDNGICEYDSYITSKHPLIKKMMDKLFKEIERMEGLARNALYDHLYQTYEDLTSEEAILETIQANEYEFLEDGTIA